MQRNKLNAEELKTIRTAATYLKKAADIIYNRGNGSLIANGISERAYAVANMLKLHYT